MNNKNVNVELLHAALDAKTSERLLALDVDGLVDHPKLGAPYAKLEILTDPTERVFRFRTRFNERQRGPIAAEYRITKMLLPPGETVRLTFYNTKAYIEVRIRRSRCGRLSYSVHVGSYRDLYHRLSKFLLPRHGKDFANFDEQRSVA